MKNIITYITYYHIDLGISTTVSVFVMKKCYTLAVPHFGQTPKYQNVGYPLLQSPILSHISQVCIQRDRRITVACRIAVAHSAL